MWQINITAFSLCKSKYPPPRYQDWISRKKLRDHWDVCNFIYNCCFSAININNTWKEDGTDLIQWKTGTVSAHTTQSICGITTLYIGAPAGGTCKQAHHDSLWLVSIDQSWSLYTLFKVQCTNEHPKELVTFSLVTLTWILTIAFLPTTLPTIPSKLLIIGQSHCVGNPDEKYMSLIETQHVN